jgi:hypothetical protein
MLYYETRETLTCYEYVTKRTWFEARNQATIRSVVNSSIAGKLYHAAVERALERNWTSYVYLQDSTVWPVLANIPSEQQNPAMSLFLSEVFEIRGTAHIIESTPHDWTHVEASWSEIKQQTYGMPRRIATLDGVRGLAVEVPDERAVLVWLSNSMAA